MKILFVYDHQYPDFWRDGLWAALSLLEKQGFEIDKFNLSKRGNSSPHLVELLFENKVKEVDFILGWGAFNSSVDKLLQSTAQKVSKKPIGLCMAGNSFSPRGLENYAIIFFETEWSFEKYLAPYINTHPGIKTEFIHAFGINSDIYKPIIDCVPIWDWTSVGAFALWKRQYLLKNKGGYRLAIGEIQKNNITESMEIISDLMIDGVAISDMVEPEVLTKIYNSSERIFIPADINGGGERAVLEARACGRPVEVEPDNPKLKELLTWKEHNGVPDQFFYADRLLESIKICCK